MRTRNLCLAIFAGLVVASVPAHLFAQVSNSALAQALFDEGKRLMRDGHYADACPKFAESMRLDPSGGTLLNLAICNESLGKTATAWGMFGEVIARAKTDKRPDRLATAKQHLDALETRLARLTISVKAPAPTLRVTIDDVEVTQAAWGIAFPIDPGQHRVLASAPSYKNWDTTVDAIKDNDQRVVEIPLLEPAPPPVATVASSAQTGSSASPAPPASAPSGGGSPLKTVGLVVGGVGVVSLVLGGVFYGIGAGKWSDRNAAYSDGYGCVSKACTDAQSAAKSDLTWSYVFLGAGAVLAIGGGALFLFGPSNERTASVRVVPGFSANGGGLLLTGSF